MTNAAVPVGVAARTATGLTCTHPDGAVTALHAITGHRDDGPRTRTQNANRFHALRSVGARRCRREGTDGAAWLRPTQRNGKHARGRPSP